MRQAWPTPCTDQLTHAASTWASTPQITSFDPKTKKHGVRYRDGDTADLALRHEAVQVRRRGHPPLWLP